MMGGGGVGEGNDMQQILTKGGFKQPAIAKN